MDIIISQSGEGHGWGKAIWKWVSGLTKDEQQAVQDGQVVLITGCPKSGGGNGTGTTLRRVIYVGGRYLHRVPTKEMLAEAELRGETIY